MIWWKILIVVIVAYLLGNISFARIISRAKHSDVTKLGSGNPGSTNMLRNFGFKVGFATFLCDVLKGFLPAFVCTLVLDNPCYAYIAGVSSVVGHIYPVLYKFKGGKGIATMIGFFFAVDPLVTLCVVLLAALCWILFKYGSVASFWCVTALTVCEGIKAKINLPLKQSRLICLLLFCIFLLTWYAHRANIERLLIGKESKVSLIKSTKKKMKKD